MVPEHVNSVKVQHQPIRGGGEQHFWPDGVKERVCHLSAQFDRSEEKGTSVGHGEEADTSIIGRRKAQAVKDFFKGQVGG